jgi:hypothetical protein
MLFSGSAASAFTLAFEAADFGLNPTFSDVQTFEFTIEVEGPLRRGAFLDPALVGVVYHVFGELESTPSGFSTFNLHRTIGGAEYYQQGSSLQFEIAASANFADGLQASELVGDVGVFVFNGREVGTGRYHPALFELNADGTGLIRNSNNMGGVNPGSMQIVDVDVGDEYVTELSFDPETLTLAPEPSETLLMGVTITVMGIVRRRGARQLRTRTPLRSTTGSRAVYVVEGFRTRDDFG